jgi:SAM-dependent methyltransferase
VATADGGTTEHHRYIHGFGPAEEQRLRDQAAVLAPVVLGGLDLPATGHLLELGCGVGAELDLLAAHWPGLTLTGIELGATHAGAAARYLGERGRVVRGDAATLPFADGGFDVVLTVWLLEHVPRVEDVMREALRVLRPDGLLVCTEVDNASFRFTPELPAIRAWWDVFCSRQEQAGGDPYVGRKLAGIARGLGCRQVNATDLAVVSSTLTPSRRTELLDYVRDLLLSGATALHAVGLADDAKVQALHADFDRAGNDSTVEFEYHGVRLICRPPDTRVTAAAPP